MAEANGKDTRTLKIADDDGAENQYNVADMDDDAKLLYAKLELLIKDSMNRRVTAELALEQNDILQKHYLEQLKPLLKSVPIQETKESPAKDKINEKSDSGAAKTASK
tara:strand:+ start:119 stop:442 length:324 start_codon:yes stop_codon:yes gene_type:complete